MPSTTTGATAESMGPDGEGSLGDLLARLRDYDGIRARLDAGTLRPSDLRRLLRILNLPIRVDRIEIALGTPASLRRLGQVRSLPGLHLEVRSDHNGMPLYYLCRARTNHWLDSPGVVVEEYHRTPGYPRPDHRYEKLTEPGRGPLIYLGVAPLRQAAVAWLRDAGGLPGAADALLCRAAEDVFLAAWHDDQGLAIEIARTMDIPDLRRAIETLYLILQSDLCDLRVRSTPPVVQLLRRGYPHADLARVLDSLSELDGDRLADLPQAAHRGYRRLATAFAGFLRVEVSWREPRPGIAPVPLFKLLLANIRWLERVVPLIAPSEDLDKARQNLADRARESLEDLGL